MSDGEAMPVAGGLSSEHSPGAIISSTIPRFDSESEEALGLRFGRPVKKQADLTFEFTRDPALLHQYFELCETECRMVPQFFAAEKEYNRKGNIIIVRSGNLCVGGARLFVKTPRQTKPLFLELAGFKLADHFPQLQQKQMRYGELSRLVLLPEFRTGDNTRQIFRYMYRKSLALDLDMVFAAAPLINVRSYRQNCVAIGLKEAKIHLGIEIPPDPGFEEIRDYLFSVIVDKSPAVKELVLPDYSRTKITEEETSYV